jgi:hypothetical protein
MDQELFAVYKAKAMAYDLLDTSQPWEMIDGQSFARIEDPSKFAHRVAVAYIMEERYKNRDNIQGVR